MIHACLSRITCTRTRGMPHERRVFCRVTGLSSSRETTFPSKLLRLTLFYPVLCYHTVPTGRLTITSRIRLERSHESNLANCLKACCPIRSGNLRLNFYRMDVKTCAKSDFRIARTAELGLHRTQRPSSHGCDMTGLRKALNNPAVNDR